MSPIFDEEPLFAALGLFFGAIVCLFCTAHVRVLLAQRLRNFQKVGELENVLLGLFVANWILLISGVFCVLKLVFLGS